MELRIGKRAKPEEIIANPADLGPALAIISFAVLVPATALIYFTRKHYATQLEHGADD